MPPELRSAKTILLHPPLRSDERQSSAIEAKKGPCSPKQEPFSFSCPADEMIQQSETHSLYYLSGYPQVDLSVSPRHGSISSATGRHGPRAHTISDSRWNRSRCGTSLCVGRVSRPVQPCQLPLRPSSSPRPHHLHPSSTPPSTTTHPQQQPLHCTRAAARITPSPYYTHSTTNTKASSHTRSVHTDAAEPHRPNSGPPLTPSPSHAGPILSTLNSLP